jgi:hypothetical protein
VYFNVLPNRGGTFCLTSFYPFSEQWGSLYSGTVDFCKVYGLLPYSLYCRIVHTCGVDICVFGEVAKSPECGLFLQCW